MADAVFYLLRSGCSWRMLPREYPPWQTVYHHFRRWRLDGRLRRAHDDALRVEVRAREGRARDPSAAVIGSQLLKTSRAGGPERGYDGAKRLSGRKRHLLVDDTNGLVLAARVHGANLPDRDGGRRLLAEGLGRKLLRLKLVWADGAYTGGFREWAQEEELGWRVEVPYHRDWHATGRAVALRAGREAARLPGSAPALGGGEDLRVAEPGSPSEQGLREAAGDSGGDDLRRDEPAHAAQTGADSVKDFTPVPQIRWLQNSF